MLLGLNSYSYHLASGLDARPAERRPMDPAAMLARAADLGLGGVQFSDLRQFESLDYSYLSRLRSRAEELGLYLEVGTAGTDPAHLEDVVRVCYALGAAVLRTTIGAPRPPSPDDFEAALQRVVGDLRGALRLAKKYDVSIALENQQDLTSAELASLLDHLAGEPVGACLDTGNPLAVMEDPVQAAETLAPRALTVHLKDYQMAPARRGYALLGVPLGQGVVDLAGVVEAIRRENPEVSLNIEVAAYRHEIPALEADYLAAFTDRSARDLAAMLRLMRDRGWPGEPEHFPWDSQVGDVADEERLQREDRAVRESVSYARRLLGQESLPLDL
jgi:sugar phosphate isomerase/epimerase